MNYGEIKKTDIANGEGVRVSLFVSGCRHRCEGCFNAMTWDFDYGEAFTEKTEDELIDALSRSYVHGLTLIGGEPLEPENQPPLLALVKRVRRELPDKNVWCYSGFTFEQLVSGKSRAETDCLNELLSLIDVLIDGRFVLEKRNISLRFRGSENQRILDLKSSLQAGRAILLYD